MVANNIWYQRLKHYDHVSSNSAVRNNFSVSTRCAIFFLTTLCTGITHRLHSDLSHPAKFRDAKEIVCKTLPGCITPLAFLLHSSQLCWWEPGSTTPEPLQLHAAVSCLFPDVPFSTWTFSVAEHNLFFFSCSKR